MRGDENQNHKSRAHEYIDIFEKKVGEYIDISFSYMASEAAILPPLRMPLFRK